MKNKKALINLSIVCFSIVLVQCVNKSFITEDEKQWFQCYETGDTIVFASNTNIVKMIVDTIYIDNPKNKNPFDWEDINVFEYVFFSHEIQGVGIIILRSYGTEKVTDKDGNFTRYTYIYDIAALFSVDAESHTNQDGCISVSVGDLTISDYWKTPKYRHKMAQLSAKDGDILFKASEFVAERQAKDSVTDFVWSRNRGLLSFTVRDTAVYRLVERHPAQ